MLLTNTNDLNHIDEVSDGFSEKALDVIEKIKAIVLENKLEKEIGVTFLHKHFEIADDEILLEECDEASRTLTIRPVKKTTADAISEKVTQTMYRFDDVYGLGCTQICSPTPSGHFTSHLKNIY